MKAVKVLKRSMPSGKILPKAKNKMLWTKSEDEYLKEKLTGDKS
jgi:hypothetical protein